MSVRYSVRVPFLVSGGGSHELVKCSSIHHKGFGVRVCRSFHAPPPTKWFLRFRSWFLRFRLFCAIGLHWLVRDVVPLPGGIYVIDSQTGLETVRALRPWAVMPGANPTFR